MSDLLALAERCEAATGPDRELDAAIAVAVNAGSLPGAWKEMSDCVEAVRLGYVRHHFNGAKSLQESRPYTASIDAAMTLLDQYGVLMQLSDIGADGLPLARVGRPDLDGESIFTGISSGVSMQATSLSGLSLALCAAALRARAASTPSLNAEIAGL